MDTTSRFQKPNLFNFSSYPLSPKEMQKKKNGFFKCVVLAGSGAGSQDKGNIHCLPISHDSDVYCLVGQRVLGEEC